MCNSPAATIARSRGRPSLRAPVEHLERHTADADAGQCDAVAAQNPSGQIHRRARHRTDLDEPGGVIMRGGMAGLPSAVSTCSAGLPHR